MKKKNKFYEMGISKGSFERMVEVNQGYNETIDGLYLKEDIILIINKNLKKIICAIGMKCPKCKTETGLLGIELWFDKKKVDKLASEIVKYIKKGAKND